MADWKMAAEARRSYADMVEGADEWGASTLCGDWNVQQVTGHLASFVDVGLPSFFVNMAKHKFDYDAAADTLAVKHGERSPDQLVAALRSKASKKSAVPMFPEAMTLLDVVVHTQDVRRPLGLDGSISADMLTTALDFITQHKLAGQIIDADTLEGLALSANDIDWSHGEGDEVTGPAEAILMAVCGRPTHEDLTGPGVAILQERQSS